MKAFAKLEDFPADFGPTIVSIGNFDGVHRAHTRVLKEIAQRARAQCRRSLAVTFDPHPMRVLRPGSGLKLITPTKEKLRLIAETGIDATLVLPFTSNLSEMTAEDFVHDILRGRLQATEVHEGYNFRFGRKANGDVSLLQKSADSMGFEVILYPEMRVRKDAVSSTHVRTLLSAGEVARARHLLGRPFSIQSAPARGRGYGSKYTVPTINLAPYHELVPKDGVYITHAALNGDCFDSVTNVGNRPTFGSDSFAVESYLLDFHPVDITEAAEVSVHFLMRLRDEIKFASVQQLRDQIGRDIATAKRYFSLLNL